MSREIKFRAWNKDAKRYSKVFTLNQSVLNYTDDDGLGVIKSLTNEIVQQFTGIHDQNGNDIFEGDIISVPDDYDTYGFNAGEKYEIFFNAGGFRCKPKINPKAKGIWLEDEGEFLIVGNIHENPELLNQ